MIEIVVLNNHVLHLDVTAVTRQSGYTKCRIEFDIDIAKFEFRNIVCKYGSTKCKGVDLTPLMRYYG